MASFQNDYEHGFGVFVGAPPDPICFGSGHQFKFNRSLYIINPKSDSLSQSNLDKVIECKAILPSAICKGSSILTAEYLTDHIQSTLFSIDPQISEHPWKWKVVVEKYLQMFGTASFRTQNLFYLAEINGIVQFNCWKLFHVLPMKIHPSSARSMLSLKSEGNRAATKSKTTCFVAARFTSDFRDNIDLAEDG